MEIINKEILVPDFKSLYQTTEPEKIVVPLKFERDLYQKRSACVH